MPTGSSHHFDGLQDEQGNVSDSNLNSLDSGCNVNPVLSKLQVNVEAGRFVSSTAYEEFGGASAQPVPASTVNGVVYLTPGGGTPTLVIAAGPFPGAEHMPLAEFDTDTVQVLAIRDKRARVGTSVIGGGPPSGVAAGVLAGTYPAPTFAAGALVNADVNAAAGIAESKLALNFATHSPANDPSVGEKAALAGTSGVPGGGNQYVTNADARNADARAPLAHATAHQHGGADEVATATPGANAIPKADGAGKLDAWITGNVFGADRQFVAATPRTTTVAGPGAPTLVAQIVTGALTGTYLYRWGADVDNNGAAFAGSVRVRNVTDAVNLDGTPLPYGPSLIAVADAKRVGGEAQIVLAGVSKTINLEHYDNAGGNTQGIARAFVEFMRVA